MQKFLESLNPTKETDCEDPMCIPVKFLSSCLISFQKKKKEDEDEDGPPPKKAIKPIQESRPCQSHDFEMTKVTFLFVILLTRIVSSDTWLRLDQCSDLSQNRHNEEIKTPSSIVLHENAGFHDKAKLKCERWVNSWWITVTLLAWFFDSCEGILSK